MIPNCNNRIFNLLLQNEGLTKAKNISLMSWKGCCFIHLALWQQSAGCLFVCSTSSKSTTAADWSMLGHQRHGDTTRYHGYRSYVRGCVWKIEVERACALCDWGLGFIEQKKSRGRSFCDFNSVTCFFLFFVLNHREPCLKERSQQTEIRRHVLSLISSSWGCFRRIWILRSNNSYWDKSSWSNSKIFKMILTYCFWSEITHTNRTIDLYLWAVKHFVLFLFSLNNFNLIRLNSSATKWCFSKLKFCQFVPCLTLLFPLCSWHRVNAYKK